MKIQFPAIFAIDEKFNKNSIQQLIQPKDLLEVVLEDYQKDRVKGYVITPTDDSKDQIFAISNQANPPEEFTKVLQIKPDDLIKNNGEVIDLSYRKWIKHPKLSKVPKRRFDYKKRLKKVLDSWQDAFLYKSEDINNNVPGLRPPQIGAVHATHAHWIATNETATIVMPTGTGKTETMLSILISKRCEKLLVVVPTDALRTQIADKFLTLGILKDFGILSAKGFYPIVGILNHKPKNCDDVDDFFEKCNVIVTTMHIAGLRDTDIRERMAYHCPFLFIDEAHHTPAETWKMLKQTFSSKKVLQFTATPFRNDDKLVDGKVIFNYPIKRAQVEGYFKPIHFKPVKEYNLSRVDQVIAESAVKQLREDCERYDHILMARVGSIERAEEVFSIYTQYPEFNPVQIHTGIKSIRKREEIRKKIITGKSKIVICVDMLGEGFDLPQLKIAAFHDIRKSLAVTIQLAGRFTRSEKNVGDATFIANIADVIVQDELRNLYYQDSNWDVLLSETSEKIIQDNVDLQELIRGFKPTLTNISLQNLRPAMSTIIYKTKCKNWKPENFEKGMQERESFDYIKHTINHQEDILIIVSAQKTPVNWAQAKDIYDWNCELYILFWDKNQDLLFIHSSDNSGYYEKLAKAVAGEAELIRGGSVFRCFSGINQLKLQNVGLIEYFEQFIRFTMRTGPDIDAGLTQVQRQKAAKSNIFGAGYEKGDRTTIGCSYKGRIWSRRKTDLDAWRKWCSVVGRKVLDETIDADQVLKGTLIPKIISQRPQKMPISIEWPEMIYKESEKIFTMIVDDHELPLFQTDIKLINPTKKGDLKFGICSHKMTIKCNLTISDKDYDFSIAGSRSVLVKWRSKFLSLKDFLNQEPPRIRFADGSFLEGNDYFELKEDSVPYPKEQIQTWDWDGVNIKKESQGVRKETDSIQYRVIRELKKKNYKIIFDDDGSREAADVVCLRVRKQTIIVEFYHCKFSEKEIPGARISDLYTVCGQAQKSIHWMENPDKLLVHLLRRKPKTENGKEVSRFEKGNQNELEEIREEMNRTRLNLELKIFIVQPGLSKSGVSRDQLELLSVTENHLMERRRLLFGVIASA